MVSVHSVKIIKVRISLEITCRSSEFGVRTYLYWSNSEERRLEADDGRIGVNRCLEIDV